MLRYILILFFKILNIIYMIIYLRKITMSIPQIPQNIVYNIHKKNHAIKHV